MAWGSGYKQPGNWARLKGHVLRRDGGRCYSPFPHICAGDAVTVDHLVNVATWQHEQRPGSPHQETNLAAICQPCHDEKTEQERRAGLARRQPRPSAKRASEQHPNAPRG